jgi:hypothetical protein
MYLAKMTISSIGMEPVPPNEAKAADIFSRVGYKLEEAVADLVDNCIDAGAANVLIRFVRSTQGIHSLLVADDGHGMNEQSLLEAMRFGSEGNKGTTALGKYGIGLKSASLSQAQTVTVLSKRKNRSVGRRWTVENIREGWQCERLSPSQCTDFLGQDFSPVAMPEHGTIVIWERLEHLKAMSGNVDKVLEKSKRRLTVELGIKFHRILSRGSVAIHIDDIDLTEEEPSLAIPVFPLDPFEYVNTGSADYPKLLNIPIGKKASLELTCHIWPPNSNAAGYKLGGGKVASRQGFYFYRNDRLIQAGGWNGILADESEPHMSLARVAVDLPSELESVFKLDIGKSSIDPPADFHIGLTESGQHTQFRKFLIDAEAAYRGQKKKESAKFPFVLGAGVPKSVRTKVRNALQESGLPASREVRFVWSALDPDEVIQLEGNLQTIHLNRRYKSDLVAETGHEGALIKLLVLLLFQDDLGKSFLSGLGKERLRRINQALIGTFSA